MGCVRRAENRSGRPARSEAAGEKAWSVARGIEPWKPHPRKQQGDCDCGKLIC